MTTEAPEEFFSNPANLALLRRLANDLRSQPSDAPRRRSVNGNLIGILDLMTANASTFDKYCTSNIEWIGGGFIGAIKSYFEIPSGDRSNIVGSIFTDAYRFLCELEFAQPGNASPEVRQILNFAQEHLDDFTGIEKQQILFACYAMPSQLTRRLIGHPSVGEVRKFSETIRTAANLRESWDKDLDDRQRLLNGLKENLEKITTAYNFVGLVNGFQNLMTKKDGDRQFSFFSLIGLGLLMMVIPFIQMVFVYLNFDQIEIHKGTLAFTIPTILAFELILLYFFRVVLSQFNSSKAQLLQLELRVTLCQFIQSYTEYAAKLKASDPNALAKFEALVFSGLVAEGSGIPSTFDGIEQVANLIKVMRGGGSKD